MRHLALLAVGVFGAGLAARAQQENLIKNGGFENGQAGWTMAVAENERGRAVVTTKDPYQGKHALFMDATGLNHEVGAMSDAVPVQAGKRYRLKTFVKQTAGYGLYKVVIDWENAEGRHISYANDWAGANCPVEYTAHGGDFRAPAGATQARLLVGVSAGSACLMDDFSLTPLPPQGAELHAYLFCSLPNAAGEFAVEARVQNDGDEAARGVTVHLECPPGLSVEKPDATLPDLLPGKPQHVTWTTRGKPRDGNAPLTARVTAHGATPAGASTPPFVTVGQITPGDGHGVPEPHPVSTKPLVGAYYFPVMLDWDRAGWGVRKVDYLTPTLGYYNEALPEVADWHIKWAVEHGIGFLAYDWYYNDGTRYLQDALEKGLLHSRYLSKIKFCVNWCNEGQATWDRPLNFSTDSLRGFMTYLCDHYFRYPEYLRVNGRPLVMIIRPDPIIEWHGGLDGSRTALDAMREVARQHGYPDPYLMCIGSAQRSAFYRRAGYDAITAYSYGFADAPRYPNGDCEYEDLVPAHERIWAASLREARAGGLQYMPVVWTGWDNYARARDNSVRTLGNTAARFRTMCQLGSKYVDPKLNMLIIEAWNEWGEGGFLEPSRERGFSFLGAVRDVFSSARGPHTDVIPTPEQVASYNATMTAAQIDEDYIRRDRIERGIGPITRIDFEFNRDGDLEGWIHCGDLTTPAVKDACLRLRSTGADPQIHGPELMDVPAAEYRALEIRMSVDRGRAGQVFWMSQTAARFTEEASVFFQLIPDGQFHVYRVPVADNAQWRGTIAQIRLDPTDAAGATIAVDYVRGVR